MCPHRIWQIATGSKKQHKAKTPLPVDVESPADPDQPRELPHELWGTCLQSLYLQGNRIQWLPDYIGSFGGLARLDISG